METCQQRRENSDYSQLCCIEVYICGPNAYWKGRSKAEHIVKNLLPHPLALSLNLPKCLKGNSEVCLKRHKYLGLKGKGNWPWDSPLKASLVIAGVNPFSSCLCCCQSWSTARNSSVELRAGNSAEQLFAQGWECGVSRHPSKNRQLWQHSSHPSTA